MGIVAAEQRWGDVDDVVVDQALTVELAGHVRTSLDQDLEHTPPTQFVEQVGQLALELQSRLDLGFGRCRTEDDAKRVATLDVAHGERRVVGSNRAGTHHDGVAVGP